jgi:hypothetical protein
VERRCFSTYLPRERRGGEGGGRREEEGERRRRVLAKLASRILLRLRIGPSLGPTTSR